MQPLYLENLRSFLQAKAREVQEQGWQQGEGQPGHGPLQGQGAGAASE